MVQFGLLVRRSRGGHLARLGRRPTTVLLRMMITVVMVVMMVMVGGGRRRVASCPRRASAHRGSFL